MNKLNQVRGILGTESISDTIEAAFREVTRVQAARDLAARAGSCRRGPPADLLKVAKR